MQITINTLDNGVTFGYTPKEANNATPQPFPMQTGQGTKNIYTTDEDAPETLKKILADFRK